RAQARRAGARRESAGGHARRSGLAYLRRRQTPRDSGSEGGGGGRSHRLRRRVSRRTPLRHRPRLGLDRHRQARGGDGRDQDRAARRAEPRSAPRRDRRALQERLRSLPARGLISLAADLIELAVLEPQRAEPTAPDAAAVEARLLFAKLEPELRPVAEDDGRRLADGPRLEPRTVAARRPGALGFELHLPLAVAEA